MKSHENEVNKRLANAENEASRYQFTYEHTSQKGQWLQWFLKKLIAKSIHFWYELIKGKYDKNAYVFQDPRLLIFREFVKRYVEEWMEERKQKIVLDSLDVSLFLNKEDIWWRNHFMNMMRIWCEEIYPTLEWKGEPLYRLDEVEEAQMLAWKGK